LQDESDNEDEDDAECICGHCKLGKDPTIAKRCCGMNPCMREKNSGNVIICFVYEMV
jgi:hypothetical protein